MALSSLRPDVPSGHRGRDRAVPREGSDEALRQRRRARDGARAVRAPASRVLAERARLAMGAALGDQFAAPAVRTRAVVADAATGGCARVRRPGTSAPWGTDRVADSRPAARLKRSGASRVAIGVGAIVVAGVAGLLLVRTGPAGTARARAEAPVAVGSDLPRSAAASPAPRARRASERATRSRDPCGPRADDSAAQPSAAAVATPRITPAPRRNAGPVSQRRRAGLGRPRRTKQAAPCTRSSREAGVDRRRYPDDSLIPADDGAQGSADPLRDRRVRVTRHPRGMNEFGSIQVREGDVLAGKYRIERLLGVGGMGVVVAARHVAARSARRDQVHSRRRARQRRSGRALPPRGALGGEAQERARRSSARRREARVGRAVHGDGVSRGQRPRAGVDARRAHGRRSRRRRS